MVFPLQILRTPHCFPHASSSRTHCVYIITLLECAVDLTNNLFTSHHSAPPPHTSCVSLLSFCSRLSLCVEWGIWPPDCCPWRAPRRGQGPHSSVPRLAHGEWNRPVLHGPRWRPPSWARGGVPLQRIPFSEAKGEPPLTALTYSYLGIWAHHLLLSHSLSRSWHTLPL